ncbi:uncharacterized protein [Asterias amurensis]|uniref:uncharacterized protein n=1 Tax=Asterias amurensis TaxID=7602 RepID=UPI003AB2248B
MASMNYTKLWSVMTVMVVFSCVLVQSDKIPIFSTSPTDTTAAVGYSVTIYCSIANRGNYQVFWNIVKNASGDAIPEEFTLGPFTNEHASYARFQIVGDVIGEYNLRISNVSKKDAGRYVCLVHDPSNGMASAIESGVSLTVLDSAEAPDIGYPKCQRDPLGNSVLTSGQYIKGDILELTCTSKGGVPLAELSWEVVYSNGLKERLLSKTLVIGDEVMTTTSLELTSLHHQSYFKCTEEHPLMEPQTCMTPFTGSESLLDVLYTPEVDMSPNVVNVMILDTVKVTMSCTAHGNPPIFRKPAIMLPVNKSGVYPLGELDKSLVEVELTVDDVGKSFYCRAENEDGIGEDTMDVLKSTSIPTWLVLVIIGSIAAVIFIFIILVSCILCVDRSKYDDATRSSNSSRPTSMKKEDDGFDNMIPIEEFQGGQESAHVNPDKTATTNDYETGETAGPRYQNVNEVFEVDEIVPHSPEPAADFVPVDLS